MFLKGIPYLKGKRHPSVLTSQKYNRLDESELLDLVTYYFKHQDQESRDKIIESHMPLALNIASKYIYKRPNKADEIQAEAVAALCKLVTQAKEKMYDTDITKYLRCNIHGAIATYLRYDNLFALPAGEKCRVYSLAPKIEKGKEDPDNIAYTNETESSALPPSTDDHLLDIFESLECLTHIEKKIILLRVEGYNDPEIAEQLGYTKNRIGQYRKDIGNKLKLVTLSKRRV